MLTWLSVWSEVQTCHCHSPTLASSSEETDAGLDRPLYLRNKLYDKTLKLQNYYSNILRFLICLVVIQYLLVRPELI